MASAAGSRLNALYSRVDVTSHEQTKNGQRLAKILLDLLNMYSLVQISSLNPKLNLVTRGKTSEWSTGLPNRFYWGLWCYQHLIMNENKQCRTQVKMCPLVLSSHWLSIKIRETLALSLADFYLQDESNVTPFNRVQISVS